MHALIAVALAGSFVSANIPAQPQWQDDYREARQLALAGKKPLAIFFGSGASGWEKMSTEGNLDPKVNELLKEKYVCMYVNTDKPYGKKLAQGFEITGKGLVISDKTGQTQAFNHGGDLSKSQLEMALVRYADRDVAMSTESVANLSSEPASSVVPAMYSPTPVSYGTTPAMYSPAPVSYGTAPQFVPSFGGGCPNGNCRR